ncbi:MAG TPA: serine/threonine-protein kinase [Kofleriaceae bacterium]|nr:serine/threonine-protein kinase [Kofleriaceae bacterium]
MLEHTLDAGRVSELELHFGSCVRCCEIIAALAGTRSLALGTPGKWAARALAEGDAPSLTGTTIHDRYEVGKLLGRGGMGAVYLAKDRTLDREVALKLHRAGSAEDRLHREAMAMAKLAHPNVVTVFEVGSVDDRLYVAMEYVRGGTLRDWLAATKRSWREILAMLLEVGHGLAAAHTAGLVHRDFKPENVLVGDDGRPRVGDFGLARVEVARPGAGERPDPAAAVGTATATGTVLGTPAYMAPEQLGGGAIDARCDQFAFCVVVWECLYGRRPFDGTTIAAIQLAIEDRAFAPISRRDIPDRVRETLVRGLSTEAGDRFADMPALIAALRRAATPRTRKRLAIAAAAGVVLVGAGIPIAGAVQSRRHEAACSVQADQIRAVYGDAQRAHFEAELVASKSPFAKASFERADRVLARYTAALAAEAEATCLGRDEPPALTAARATCLDDRKQELAGLVAALASRDPKRVMKAPGAAWAIFEPTPCKSPQIRPLTTATASTPALAKALGTVKGLDDAGRYQDALVAGKQLVADARKAGDKTVELEALIQLGQTYEALENPEAIPTMHQAQTLAESIGRDLDAAIALRDMAAFAGTTQQDYAAAHQYADLAKAKLERLGDGNLAAKGKLAATKAQLYMNDFRFAEAEPAIMEAVTAIEQAYGPDHPDLGEVVAISSQILRALGKTDQAYAASVRALNILDNALGPQHPTVAGAQLTVAQMLIDLKRFPEARERLKIADEVFAKVFGENHPVRAAVAGNLAHVEHDLGNWDAALDAYRHALAVIEKTHGPKSAGASGVRLDMMLTLKAAGRLDEALAQAQQSVAIVEAMGDDGINRLREALMYLGDIQLARGKFAEALAPAEKAMAIATQHPEAMEPDDVSGTKFVLARALWENGKDLSRARKLASEAAEVEPDPKQKQEITAWLEQHRDLHAERK